MAGLSPLAGVFVPGAAMLQMPPVLGASQAVALPETDLFGALPGFGAGATFDTYLSGNDGGDVEIMLAYVNFFVTRMTP
jgi:hypothetical protein